MNSVARRGDPVTTRRAFLGTLAGGLLAAPFTAGSVTANPRVLEAFRQGLRELGWVEGQNIVIEYRSAEGHFDRLPDLAAELVRLKVDVIVAAPTPAVLAAKSATGTVPKVRRVAVLSNPDGPAQPITIRNVKDAARSLGLQLQLVEARGPGDFNGAFAAMARERVGALFVVTDPVFIPHRARLVDLAAKNRLPSIFTQRADVEAGGLISYGPNFSDMYRRAAIYVDKILKGARPADLPVEQPTKFELVINLKTAKALGLTIPQSLLARADEVIQ